MTNTEHSIPVQELFDHDCLAGIAEHTPQHIVQLLLCFFERVENQHTFTGSQTVGLQYVGSLQFFQESVSFF